MTKEKLKQYLHYLPLIILTISALNLLFTIAIGQSGVLWKHIIGFVLLPINYYVFYKRHNVGVIVLGLTLFLGLIGILSYSSEINTFTFGIWFGSSGEVPILYCQPIFLLWMIIHLSISSKYYFGILSKQYWKNLSQSIKKEQEINE